MSPQSQRKVEAALDAARVRVSEQAVRVLAEPDVTAGRWWRELQVEIEGVSRRRALRAIKAWERHVTAFLKGIEVAIDVGLGERDTSDLEEPTDWRAGV